LIKVRAKDGRGERSGGTGGREASASTREALLRASTELFALSGFDGVSVEEIAARAGVNKALISYHFGGKRGLYLAILHTTFEAVLQRLRELEASERRPDEVLRSFMAAFHEMATVERPFFPALLLREVLGAGRTFEDEILPNILALFGVMRRIIERGVQQGVFRPVDPLLAHVGIVGSLIFFYATEPTRRRMSARRKAPGLAPPAEEFLRHMQEMASRGLQAGEGACRGRRAKGGRS
jgi:AcrR family transcriptional regulator